MQLIDTSKCHLLRIDKQHAAEEGDQKRFWKLTRRFVDSLVELDPARKVRVVRACLFAHSTAIYTQHVLRLVARLFHFKEAFVSAVLLQIL